LSGEWDIDRLDLGAYLRRVGHDGDTAPTERTLAALHRAHIAAIPFENVDIVLGRGIDLDLGAIQAKLVDRRRGGYCYEHGLLFAAVLGRLGFTVERFLARIGGYADRPRARTHMLLRVRIGARDWLADVGFGSGLLEPLPFDALGAQTQGAWTYELAVAGPASWELRELEGEDWVTRYGFADERQYPADFAMANHFTSTFPRSPFVGQLLLLRREPDVIKGLVGRTLTLIQPDRSVEERQLRDDELGEALDDVFGVSLNAGELAELVAAPSLIA
jgi:N-hydroxyarylamine O-acetyltransferase